MMGLSWGGLPSQRHYLLTQAVQMARQHGLGDIATSNRCSTLVSEVKIDTKVSVAQAFLTFEQELTKHTNE